MTVTIQIYILTVFYKLNSFFTTEDRFQLSWSTTGAQI